MAADECIGALESYQDGGSCSRLGELLNVPLAIVGMKHLVEYNTREVEIFLAFLNWAYLYQHAHPKGALCLKFYLTALYEVC